METANIAVKKAMELGASEAEAYVLRRGLIQVSFSDRIKNLKTTFSTGLGLRVALGKRTAMYATSILAEEEVGEAVERVMSIVRVAPEDPDWNHANMVYGETPVKHCYDEAIPSIEYDDIVAKIGSAVTTVTEHDRKVRPTRGMLQLGTDGISITNSYGDAIEGRGTHTGAYMSVKAEDAGLKSTGAEFQETRFWEDLDMDGLAGSAAEKAISFLTAKPTEGGEMPVIIRNKVFASILGVMLREPINADLVQKGGSPFADKMGDRIAAEGISVVDDGTMDGGVGTAPFDDEGHPTQKTHVIEDGVLKSFLYDSYTALKDSIESTGNASRSDYSSPPSPAPSNLILKAGGSSVGEMVEDTVKGLYVERVIGEWLSNPISGNMNATVTHGFLIEDGELGQPVKGVILAGNFHELLLDGFEVIGSDIDNSGNYYSPTVKLRKLTVAGK